MAMRGRVLIIGALLIAGCDGGSSENSNDAATQSSAMETSPTDVIGRVETPSHGMTTTLAGQPSLGNSPENPMPVGGSMSVGGWDVTVLDVTTNVEASAGEFIEVAIRVQARYVRRPGGGRIDDDVTLSAISATGAIYSPVVEGCPNPLPVGQEFDEAGGTITGNICFSVETRDAPSVLLVIDAVGSPTPHRIFLSTDVSGTLQPEDV